MNEQELRDALGRMAGSPTATDGPSTLGLLAAIGRRRRRHRTAAALATVVVIGTASVGIATQISGGQDRTPPVASSGPTSAVTSGWPTPSTKGGCRDLATVTFLNTPTADSEAGSPEELAGRFVLPGETSSIEGLAADRATATLIRADGTPRAILTLRAHQGTWGVERTGACTTPATTESCGAELVFSGVTYQRYKLPRGVGPGAGRLYGQALVTGCGPDPVGPVTVYQANEEPRRAALVVSLAKRPQYYVNSGA